MCIKRGGEEIDPALLFMILKEGATKIPSSFWKGNFHARILYSEVGEYEEKRRK